MKLSDCATHVGAEWRPELPHVRVTDVVPEELGVAYLPDTPALELYCRVISPHELYFEGLRRMYCSYRIQYESTVQRL